MSGRRVAPPSARTARSSTRSRGARRADTGALAAWGVGTARHRQAVSLATLSAVLLVSTALVSGGTSQPELAAEHDAAPHAQAKGSTSGTSGVVLSRPADRQGGSRTAVANGPAKKSGEATAPPADGSGPAGEAGATEERAQLTSQSSEEGTSGTGSGTGTAAPQAGQPGSTAPGPEAGGGAPGDGGAEPPAPGTPAEPEPSAPANPSAPPVVPPVVQPPATQPPAPKPPAPQPGTPAPGTPAPQPPQNSGCTITILGIRICLPLLGG